MSTKCLKKSIAGAQEKFFAGKFTKLTKVIKPVLKFMSKKHRTNAVTPSSCNYDITEKAQNDFNECELFQLHFKFCEEAADNEANEMTAEMNENLENERLEERLRRNVELNEDENLGIETIVEGKTVVQPIYDKTYFAIPVHFVEVSPGEFKWAPLPDVDIRKSGVETLTGHQIAEQQVPIPVS